MNLVQKDDTRPSYKEYLGCWKCEEIEISHVIKNYQLNIFAIILNRILRCEHSMNNYLRQYERATKSQISRTNYNSILKFSWYTCLDDSASDQLLAKVFSLLLLRGQFVVSLRIVHLNEYLSALRNNYALWIMYYILAFDSKNSGMGTQGYRKQTSKEIKMTPSCKETLVKS